MLTLDRTLVAQGGLFAQSVAATTQFGRIFAMMTPFPVFSWETEVRTSGRTAALKVGIEEVG